MCHVTSRQKARRMCLGMNQLLVVYILRHSMLSSSVPPARTIPLACAPYLHSIYVMHGGAWRGPLSAFLILNRGNRRKHLIIRP